jgi:hypothetical protein
MRKRFSIGLALLLCSGVALADRQPGWDFGGELLYQFSQNVDFEGGSKADLDDDLGLALSFTYRFNSRFELLFGVDWNSVDYQADIAPAPVSPGGPIVGTGFSVDGELEYWTPRVGVNFNLLEGDLTPYVTGGVGWSFIDTNIPEGRAQTPGTATCAARSRTPRASTSSPTTSAPACAGTWAHRSRCGSAMNGIGSISARRAARRASTNSSSASSVVIEQESDACVDAPPQ